MKITTAYSKIKSVTYEFDEHDIYEALKEKCGFAKDPNAKWDIEFYEDDNGHTIAEITVNFVTEDNDRP